MNFKLKTSATAILAVALVASTAHALDGDSDRDPNAPAKRHATKKPKTPPGPTVEEQIHILRQELQGQIDSLKTDLADKDAQVRKAQQAAADAQSSADKANAAAAAETTAVADNAAAVTTLHATVTDLKGNQASLAATVSDETAKIKREIESPNVIHYKGIDITPGGFAAGETIYRTKATGGDIPTAFNALPYEGADAYSLSEFYGTGRQSRLSLQADGKTRWGTLRGYWEADFLGTGTTSNNNQSNSYVLRQRIIYGSAETNSGWKFAGGQMWSLATETRKGISNDSSDILLPLTIDPNYVPGFAWARQYGFRVVKSFSHGAIGISAENPQLLYTASLAGNTPYAVLGSVGNNGGAYNATISACSPSTSVVNYTNQAETDSAGNTIDVAVPVYKTVNSCANVTNISFNRAPDFLAKIAIDPGWGHFEVFGILGDAHETVYPGETTNSNLYGGLTDVAASAASGTTVLAAPALTSAGYFSDSLKIGGVGGSLRVPIIPNIFTFGVKGMLGPGIGRYGDSTLADVTANANGELEPIHNVSGLLTAEITPNPRLSIYLNYGGDYAGREDEATPTATTLGAPKATFCITGTTTCTSSPMAADIAAGGAWGATWKAPSAAAVGYGSRLLSTSSCSSIAAPGYSGSSTGYYPGGSCSAQTRDVQEITGGWWYDIYRGEHGRFRQGFQYGYAVREGWSGAVTNAFGLKGIDNMFWTSLRYYLP
jgi:hypothetical protein